MTTLHFLGPCTRLPLRLRPMHSLSVIFHLYWELPRWPCLVLDRTRVITGSFLFSSQGSFRVGGSLCWFWRAWVHRSTSLDTGTLSQGGPGPHEGALWSTSVFSPYAPCGVSGHRVGVLLSTTFRHGGSSFSAVPHGFGEPQ